MNILNDILSQSTPVEEVSSIDSATFKKKYYNKKAVVIKGLANNWGATKNWDLDFLLNQKEDKDIYLLSGNFIQDDNRYTKASFKDYIKKLKAAAENKEAFKEYLTTLNIFNYYPHLKKSIDFSVFEKYNKINDVTAWIGPANTVSGFHNDTGKNMYAQIKGEKMFILSSTKFNKKMYPSDKYINGAVASQVDINNFDKTKFPKFKDVEFLSVTLKPGDVLHVPSKWWHYVQSLDTSISISNFGYSKLEMFTIRVIDFLHRRGYYKTKNCFCCNKS